MDRGRGNAERNMETFVVGARARCGVVDYDNRAPSVPQANYTKSSKLTARPVLNSGGHNRLLPPSPLLLLLLLLLLLCWACESKREGAIADRNERSKQAIERCRCAGLAGTAGEQQLRLTHSLTQLFSRSHTVELSWCASERAHAAVVALAQLEWERLA